MNCGQLKRGGCRWVVVGLLVIVLVGGVWLYRMVVDQVNLTGVLSDRAVASVRVPPGFEVNLFAAELDDPRFLTFGPDGVLYVAERGSGRITALIDRDGDGQADTRQPFADGLDRPHSVTFHNGALYVGVPSGVVRLEDADGDGRAETRTTIIDDYPTSGHNTRTVAFLPDGRMVVSVGSGCNACVESDPRRAAILIYEDATGAGERLFARGLRNAVGLAVRPETGRLWATNNGRDLMGDDLPPETLYVVRDGADYGWPFCHNGDIIDPELGQPGDCAGVERPVVEMQAHSAPLGLAFYTGEAFPASYHGDLFIAFHGSWNRSTPTGYKVVRLPFTDGEPAGAVEDFATGWLNADGTADGRPVGLAVGPDGALYVSDDKGGFIYRISYAP